MKAIKLYNIKWDKANIPEDELDKLPTEKGFIVNDDDFSVVDKVPGYLKKKYGWDVLNFAFNEIKIFETFEDLLYHCADKGETPKALFKVSGEPSGYGRNCIIALKNYISRRLKLESKGTSPYDMPKILDEVMLSLEKITGMDWDDNHTFEEWCAEIDKYLKTKMEEVLSNKEAMKEMRKAARKAAKEKLGEKGDDEDEDEDDDDDNDDEDEE